MTELEQMIEKTLQRYSQAYDTVNNENRRAVVECNFLRVAKEIAGLMKERIAHERKCALWLFEKHTSAEASLKRLVDSNPLGYGAVKREWAEPPVEFILYIDDDHTAYLTMSQDDYDALQKVFSGSENFEAQIAKRKWEAFKLWNIETGGHKSPEYFPYWLDREEE